MNGGVLRLLLLATRVGGEGEVGVCGFPSRFSRSCCRIVGVRVSVFCPCVGENKR